MEAIGGYFELEKYTCSPKSFHDGVLVNSGRNALEYILRSIGKENIDTIYLPKYTCEVILEPLIKLDLNYKFYDIGSDLELVDDLVLNDKDYVIVNNYFGILDNYIAHVTQLYFDKIIVDNSQALYTPLLPGQQAFFSPRKFVGVPDGGIAYAKGSFDIKEKDQSEDRISHLIKRTYGGAEYGYSDFIKNDAKLIGRQLMEMSDLTRTMLERIDFDRICDIRKQNYTILRNALEEINLLKTPLADDIACPMVYPFMTKDVSLRKKLITHKIFVATYWPNTFDWCTTKDIEYTLVEGILPLPIDQRYEIREMNQILDLLQFQKQEYE